MSTVSLLQGAVGGFISCPPAPLHTKHKAYNGGARRHFGVDTLPVATHSSQLGRRSVRSLAVIGLNGGAMVVALGIAGAGTYRRRCFRHSKRERNRHVKLRAFAFEESKGFAAEAATEQQQSGVTAVIRRNLLGFLGVLGLVPVDFWLGSCEPSLLRENPEWRQRQGSARMVYLTALFASALIGTVVSDGSQIIGGGAVSSLAFVSLLLLVPDKYWCQVPMEDRLFLSVESAGWKRIGASRVRYLFVLMGPVFFMDGFFDIMLGHPDCDPIGFFDILLLTEAPTWLYSDLGLMLVGASLFRLAFTWTALSGFPETFFDENEIFSRESDEIMLMAPGYKNEADALERVWRL